MMFTSASRTFPPADPPGVVVAEQQQRRLYRSETEARERGVLAPIVVPEPQLVPVGATPTRTRT
jgi:hypothetical protein